MEQYKADILWNEYLKRKQIGLSPDVMPQQVVEELQEKMLKLQKELAGKPTKIESPELLTRVIDLGLAKSASKARDWLAKHKIGTPKDLEAYANLEKLNKENKPLIDQK